MPKARTASKFSWSIWFSMVILTVILRFSDQDFLITSAVASNFLSLTARLMVSILSSDSSRSSLARLGLKLYCLTEGLYAHDWGETGPRQRWLLSVDFGVA